MTSQLPLTCRQLLPRIWGSSFRAEEQNNQPVKMAKLTPSTVQFFVDDEWVVVGSSDTDSDGVISLDDDDADSLERSALSSSPGNHQGLGSVQGHDGAGQSLGPVQDLDGLDQILGSIQDLDVVEESAGIIHDFGGVDETLGVIRGHGGTFDQYDGGSHQEEEDLDEDYDKGDEAYGLDDELVPWAVSGKFGRQRMRKLGKRACAKMHTSKRSPYLYVKPGCVRGKHGLGLKHNYW